MSHFDGASAVRIVVKLTIKEIVRRPYTDAQKLLFSKIRESRDHLGMTYKDIADKLDAEGFLTPMGHRLTAEHVFGIYKKGKIRAKNFAQKPVVTLDRVTVI